VEQAYVHLIQFSLVPRFSEHFALGRSQPELDFVDIDLTADLSVYVDPFAISLYPAVSAARAAPGTRARQTVRPMAEYEFESGRFAPSFPPFKSPL
jgi:hypothetical protein